MNLEQANQIGTFASLAWRHMVKHQPNRRRALGPKVKEYLEDIQSQADQYQTQATSEGVPFETTREVIRETWISLPDLPDGLTSDDTV